MPQAQTKARRGAAAKNTAATRRRPAAGAADGQFQTAVDRTTELSEQVLEAVKDGQRSAIEAVHKFVDTVDRSLPAHGPDAQPSKRQEVIDSALEMADRLVKSEYEFLRTVVHSAGKSMKGTEGAKK